MGSHWNANRAEFSNHYRGWTGIAVKAIADEIAGDPPLVAIKRDAQQVERLQRKAMRRAGKSHFEKQVAYKAHRKRYLNPHARKKAMASLQMHEELEPVDPQHRLVRLLQNPNGPDVAWSFFFKIAMYLELHGETYIWVVRDRIGRPTELWVLPTHWVIPRPDPEGKELIGFYEVRPMSGMVANEQGLGWFPGGAGKIEIPAKDMIPIWYPSPTNFLGGQSPVAAISEWIDCSENIDKSRVSQFQNAAFPGVVVEIDKEIANPDVATIDRLKAEIEARYVGVRRTGKPMVMGPGMKLVPVTHSPEEMDYANSGDQLKNWILAAHRVGQSIVGLAENTNYASMIAARANFQTSKIRPMRILIGQVLTEKLASEFNSETDKYVIYFEDKTPQDPAEQRAAHQAYYGMQAMTPNEIRQDLGMPAFEHGGDDPMGSMGLQPLPWATGEQPMGQGMDLGGMMGQMGGQQPGQQDPNAQPPQAESERDA